LSQQQLARLLSSLTKAPVDLVAIGINLAIKVKIQPVVSDHEVDNLGIVFICPATSMASR